MFNKLRKTLYIEEILGVTTLVLAIFLFLFAFIFVRLLVSKIPAEYPRQDDIQAEIELFRLEEAEKALER